MFKNRFGMYVVDDGVNINFESDSNIWCGSSYTHYRSGNRYDDTGRFFRRRECDCIRRDRNDEMNLLFCRCQPNRIRGDGYNEVFGFFGSREPNRIRGDGYNEMNLLCRCSDADIIRIRLKEVLNRSIPICLNNDIKIRRVDFVGINRENNIRHARLVPRTRQSGEDVRRRNSLVKVPAAGL